MARTISTDARGSHPLAVTALLLLTGCGWVEGERREAAEAARTETLAEVQAQLEEAVRRADRVAGSADRILSPLPVMTPAEEGRLRRFLGAAHVTAAGRVGVRVADDRMRDSLVAAGRLVELEDSSAYWIVRERTAPAFVVPELRSLLVVVGRRFQDHLEEIGLPAYRIEVTSALRTAEHQARLRRTNGNAASGVSSHEFGATVDLSYAAFAPPAERPGEVLAEVPAALQAQIGRLTDLALESVSARKSRELARIFSRILDEAQDEGLALVIYERQQTVYHLTATTRAAPRP